MSLHSDPRPAGRKSEPAGTHARTASVTRRGLLALGPTMAVAAACSPSKPASNKPTPKTNPVDKVKYRTGFATFGREGYVVVAKEKGFFRDAGLDVEILVGTAQPQDMTEMIQGQYDFTTSETSQFIIQKVTGVSKGAHVISAVHQRTVIALMSLKEDTSIAKPQDLQDKTVGYGAPAPQALFPSYARLDGFAAGDMKKNWKLFPATQLPALLAARSVHAIGQFVPGQPAVQKAAQSRGLSGDINVWPYGDVLADLYGNVTATSDKTLAQRPDLVKRFNEALLKGLQYAVEHPDEAGQLINKTWTQTPAAVAQAELTVMKPYVLTNGVPVGALDEARIQRAIALLVNIGVIKPGAVTSADFGDFGVAPKP
jgi:NitT/TauT family transport system substrate-binding protein